MAYAIFGLLSLAGALACFLIRRGHVQKVSAMRATPTLTAQEITNPGNVGRVVEMQGSVRCAEPLVSPLAQARCVYYHMQVDRAYEEASYRTDSNGNRTREMKQKRETIEEKTRSVPFQLEDATGVIAIDPDDAQYLLRPTIKRFQRHGIPLDGQLLPAELLNRFLHSDRHTKGYHLLEELLHLDTEAFVLGEITATGDRITLTRPQDKATPLLIADRPEEIILRDLTRAIVWLTIGLVAFGLIGLGLVTLGIVSGVTA